MNSNITYHLDEINRHILLMRANNGDNEEHLNQISFHNESIRELIKPKDRIVLGTSLSSR